MAGTLHNIAFFVVIVVCTGMIHATSHADQEKRVVWFSISYCARLLLCSYSHGALFGGPLHCMCGVTCNLDAVSLFQSDKNIFSFHVWNNLESQPLVIFEDGSSMFLAELLSNSENRKVKRRRSTKSSQE